MHIRIRSSYYSLLEYCIHKINSIYIYYFSCEYVINVLYKRKPSDLQLIDQPTWNLLFVTLLGVLYKRLQYFILLLRLSTRSSKQTGLLQVLMIYMLFVKHLWSKIFPKIMAQKTERYVTLWKSLGNSFAGSDLSCNMIYLTWLLLFFQEFASIIPFMTWFDILTNSREGGYFFKSIIACRY